MGRGAVSATIRFLCHVPFGYYAFAGVNHFTFMRDHADVLLAPPLGPRIFVGEVFSGPIGVIGFFWNFFLWLPTMDSKGSGLVLLGIVDAIFTGFLIIALSIEASFIGFTSAQCAQLRPGAAPTSSLIYFQRVAEIEFEEKNIGEETCQGYYAKWYVGLVVAILYALSAFANITLGASSRGSDRYNDYRDYIRPFWRSATSPIEYFKRGLVDLAYDLMPTRMQYYLSFANRYVEHSFRRQRSKMSQKAQKAYALLPWRARSSKDKESGLSTVLSQEVLERMSPHLHYVDIVSLSLTSKAVRKAVFQQHGDSMVDKEQLRYYSCQGSKKYDCWACGIQICDGCSRSMLCENSYASFHMSLCAAACSECYYKTISSDEWYKRPCRCIDGRREDKSFTFTYMYGGERHNPSRTRLLCRDCHSLKKDQVLERREMRDRAVYLKLTQQPLSCLVCSESLPRTGPRWWLCSTCKRHCKSSCHVGWSQKLEAV